MQDDTGTEASRYFSTDGFQAYNAWPTFVIPHEVRLLREGWICVKPRTLIDVVEHK